MDATSRATTALRYVGNNEDVYDLANEMIGELNASHRSEGVRHAAMPPVHTRYLAPRWNEHAGVKRISNIYREVTAKGMLEPAWENVIPWMARIASRAHYEKLLRARNAYITSAWRKRERRR